MTQRTGANNNINAIYVFGDDAAKSGPELTKGTVIYEGQIIDGKEVTGITSPTFGYIQVFYKDVNTGERTTQEVKRPQVSAGGVYLNGEWHFHGDEITVSDENGNPQTYTLAESSTGVLNMNDGNGGSKLVPQEMMNARPPSPSTPVVNQTADPALPEEMAQQQTVKIKNGTGPNAPEVEFTTGNVYSFDGIPEGTTGLKSNVEYTLLEIPLATGGVYIFVDPDGNPHQVTSSTFKTIINNDYCRVTSLGAAEQPTLDNPQSGDSSVVAADTTQTTNDLLNLDYIRNFDYPVGGENYKVNIKDSTAIKNYSNLKYYNDADQETKVHYQYSGLEEKHAAVAQKFKDDVVDLRSKISKISESIGNGIWDGTAQKAMEIFSTKMGEEAKKLQEACELLVEVGEDADYMRQLSIELIKLADAREECEKNIANAQAESNKVTFPSKKEGETQSNYEGRIRDYTAKKTKWDNIIRKLNELLTNKPDGIIPQYDRVNNKMSNIENAIKLLQKAVRNILPGDPDPGDPRGSGGPPKEIEYIDTTQEQMAYYKELDPSIFDGMVLNLFALANQKGVGIEVLLSDSSYSELIKNMVLNTEGLSYDMIELVKKGNIDISQNLLRNIIFAETDEAKDIFKLNNKTNVEVIKNILQRKAGDTDLSEYIKNGSNIKNALRDIKNVNGYVGSLGGDNTANELLSVYRGDSDNSLAENSDNFESSSVIKDLLDIESSQKNLTVEDLLSSNDSIQEPLGNLYRATGFLSSIDRYSDEAAAVLISNLLK